MNRCLTLCTFSLLGLCPEAWRVKSGNMQLSQFLILSPFFLLTSSCMSKHQHVGHKKVHVPQFRQANATSSQKEASKRSIAFFSIFFRINFGFYSVPNIHFWRNNFFKQKFFLFITTFANHIISFSKINQIVKTFFKITSRSNLWKDLTSAKIQLPCLHQALFCITWNNFARIRSILSIPFLMSGPVNIWSWIQPV